MFENIIGQESIKQYFSRAISSGKLPQSIMLYGPHGVGKTAISIELAKFITCHSEGVRPCGTCLSCVKFTKMKHPDVMLIFPYPGNLSPEVLQSMREEYVENPYSVIVFEKNASIHIESVKEIKQRLKLKSYQDHGRVVILLGVENQTQEAANALLKLLEEPPDDVTFILTTSMIDTVLPTIKSRCQLLHMTCLSHDELERALIEREEVPENSARFFAALAGGSYARAVEYLQEDFKIKTGICSRIVLASTQKPLEYSVALAEELSLHQKMQETRDINVKNILEIFSAMLKYTYEIIIGGDGVTARDEEYPDIPTAKLHEYSHHKLEAAIEEVEKSIDLMGKNVYLFLILLILFIRLRKVFQGD